MASLVYDDDPPKKLQYDEPPPEPARSFTDRLQSIRDTLSPSTTGIVRGIPIVGPLLEKGVAGAAALPSAVIPGMSVRGSYDKLMEENKRLAAEHPVSSTFGETAGSIVSTVPVARALPKLFGGATMPGQITAGGIIGGTDAAVRSGGDPDAIKTGAAIGAAGPVIGSVLAPIGQGLASGGRWAAEHFPGVRSVVAKKILPESAEEIEKAATRGFQSLGGKMKYDTAALDDLNNLIKRDLYDKSMGSAKIGATKTHEVLDKIDSLPPNAASLHTIRKELNDISGVGGNEGASARYARDMIDHFLEKPPPNAVLTAPQEAATVHRRLMDANADWRTAQASKALRDRITKAQIDAGGSINPLTFLAEGQAVRKQVRNLLNDKTESRFRLPNETEALKDVAGGSAGERLLHLYGGVTGTSRPGAFTTVIPGSLAYLGLGDAGTAAATMLGGAAASAAGSALTRRATNYADNVIRANSPYAQAQMRQQLPPRILMSPSVAQMPASISAKAYRDEIARLLALQAERKATER